MKVDYKKFCIPLNSTVEQTMEAINRLGSYCYHTLLVVDESYKLIGTITDGDIRRGLLKERDLKTPVVKIMNPDPLVLDEDKMEGSEEILRLAHHKLIQLLPIINERGQVVGLIDVESEIPTPSTPQEDSESWVVLLVGGLGSRLYPLTKDTPKPLLKVQSRPILERIVEKFTNQGFKNFYFAINYKGEKLMEHFGDGQKFGARIEYLKEKTRLGTAGPLGLIDVKHRHPLIVMNGDLLTNINFHSLLKFHREQKSSATMCVKDCEIEIPYGVVNVGQESTLLNIEEKPKYSFLVNAGVYVIEPHWVDLIDGKTYLDMPDFLKMIAKNRQKTSLFPLHESWMDIGLPEDFERAQRDLRVFV